VAAHVNRARVSDTLQTRRVKGFCHLGVHQRRSRSRSHRNGHREHAAASRCIPFVYVKSRINVVVVVDSRTVPVLAVLRSIWRDVNVKCERLGLQRTQGQHDENRQGAPHVPSLWDTP
jgi:hypothetical protein